MANQVVSSSVESSSKLSSNDNLNNNKNKEKEEQQARQGELAELYQAAKDENELLEFKNYELLFRIQELELNQRKILNGLAPNSCNSSAENSIINGLDKAEEIVWQHSTTPPPPPPTTATTTTTTTTTTTAAESSGPLIKFENNDDDGAKQQKLEWRRELMQYDLGQANKRQNGWRPPEETPTTSVHDDATTARLQSKATDDDNDHHNGQLLASSLHQRQPSTIDRRQTFFSSLSAGSSTEESSLASSGFASTLDCGGASTHQQQQQQQQLAAARSCCSPLAKQKFNAEKHQQPQWSCDGALDKHHQQIDPDHSELEKMNGEEQQQQQRRRRRQQGTIAAIATIMSKQPHTQLLSELAGNCEDNNSGQQATVVDSVDSATAVTDDVMSSSSTNTTPAALQPLHDTDDFDDEMGGYSQIKQGYEKLTKRPQAPSMATTAMDLLEWSADYDNDDAPEKVAISADATFSQTALASQEEVKMSTRNQGEIIINHNNHDDDDDDDSEEQQQMRVAWAHSEPNLANCSQPATRQQQTVGRARIAMPVRGATTTTTRAKQSSGCSGKPINQNYANHLRARSKSSLEITATAAAARRRSLSGCSSSTTTMLPRDQSSSLPRRTGASNAKRQQSTTLATTGSHQKQQQQQQTSSAVVTVNQVLLKKQAASAGANHLSTKRVAGGQLASTKLSSSSFSIACQPSIQQQERPVAKDRAASSNIRLAKSCSSLGFVTQIPTLISQSHAVGEQSPLDSSKLLLGLESATNQTNHSKSCRFAPKPTKVHQSNSNSLGRCKSMAMMNESQSMSNLVATPSSGDLVLLAKSDCSLAAVAAASADDDDRRHRGGGDNNQGDSVPSETGAPDRRQEEGEVSCKKCKEHGTKVENLLKQIKQQSEQLNELEELENDSRLVSQKLELKLEVAENQLDSYRLELQKCQDSEAKLHFQNKRLSFELRERFETIQQLQCQLSKLHTRLALASSSSSLSSPSAGSTGANSKSCFNNINTNITVGSNHSLQAQVVRQSTSRNATAAAQAVSGNVKLPLLAGLDQEQASIETSRSASDKNEDDHDSAIDLLEKRVSSSSSSSVAGLKETGKVPQLYPATATAAADDDDDDEEGGGEEEEQHRQAEDSAYSKSSASSDANSDDGGNRSDSDLLQQQGLSLAADGNAKVNLSQSSSGHVASTSTSSGDESDHSRPGRTDEQQTEQPPVLVAEKGLTVGRQQVHRKKISTARILRGIQVHHTNSNINSNPSKQQLMLECTVFGHARLAQVIVNQNQDEHHSSHPRDKQQQQDEEDEEESKVDESDDIVTVKRRAESDSIMLMIKPEDGRLIGGVDELKLSNDERTTANANEDRLIKRDQGASNNNYHYHYYNDNGRSEGDRNGGESKQQQQLSLVSQYKQEIASLRLRLLQAQTLNDNLVAELKFNTNNNIPSDTGHHQTRRLAHSTPGNVQQRQQLVANQAPGSLQASGRRSIIYVNGIHRSSPSSSSSFCPGNPCARHPINSSLSLVGHQQQQQASLINAQQQQQPSGLLDKIDFLRSLLLKVHFQHKHTFELVNECLRLATNTLMASYSHQQMLNQQQRLLFDQHHNSSGSGNNNVVDLRPMALLHGTGGGGQPVNACQEAYPVPPVRAPPRKRMAANSRTMMVSSSTSTPTSSSSSSSSTTTTAAAAAIGVAAAAGNSKPTVAGTQKPAGQQSSAPITASSALQVAKQTLFSIVPIYYNRSKNASTFSSDVNNNHNNNKDENRAPSSGNSAEVYDATAVVAGSAATTAAAAAAVNAANMQKSKRAISAGSLPGSSSGSSQNPLSRQPTGMAAWFSSPLNHATQRAQQQTTTTSTTLTSQMLQKQQQQQQQQQTIQAGPTLEPACSKSSSSSLMGASQENYYINVDANQQNNRRQSQNISVLEVNTSSSSTGGSRHCGCRRCSQRTVI